MNQSDLKEYTELCIRKLQKGETFEMVKTYILSRDNGENIFNNIEADLHKYLYKYGRKIKYWILKVPTNEWEYKHHEEFNSIKEGFKYFQHFQDSHTKPMSNIDDIVFIYNSNNNNLIGIYLVCKITSKMDKNNDIQLEVLKDLRENPFDSQEKFPKLYLDFNTLQGKNKRQQFSMNIEESYNPQALYDSIINS